MSNDVELKPCPFCGSPGKSADGFSPLESVMYAWCSNSDCPLNSELLFSPEQWNTRSVE
jgi:hypothetical protein